MRIARLDNIVHDGLIVSDHRARNRRGVDIIQLPLLTSIGIAAAAAAVASSTFVVRASRSQVAVELLVTAAIVGALAWRLASPAQFAISPSVVAFGVPLAFVDARVRRLPNLLVLGFAIVTGAALVAVAVIDRDAGSLTQALIGAAVTAVFFLALYLVMPGQLGGGDVKLAGPLGGVLRWFGWSTLTLGCLPCRAITVHGQQRPNVNKKHCFRR